MSNVQAPVFSRAGGGPASVSKNFLASVSTAGSGLPSRVILHGTEGIGKSSFAANAPSPIFIQSRGETGLETLIDAGLVPQTAHFPELQSWEDVLAALTELLNEPHEFKTVVIDTLNGLEKLCHEHALQLHFGGDVVKFDAYGRGVKVSFVEWRRLFTLLDDIRSRRKMGVIALSHTRIKTFKNPDGDDYDRYSVDMHDESWGTAHKWADMVLFANYVVAVDTTGNRAKGKGGRQRVIYTTRAAAHDAKNRNALPETIQMGSNGADAWRNFTAAIKAAKPQPAAKPAAAEPPTTADATT